MSETVIKVENLGKMYLLSHQQQERYRALRDLMANRAKDFFHRGKKVLSAPFTSSPSPFTDVPPQEEFWALKDVSFEIKQGDRVGIIGRNGAGKSTLLKILSRITEPTTGRIEINGRVASLLEVGTGFHPELTGRENIFLNGAILGMGRNEIKRKFDEIVDFAEVERFLDTPVKRYSSGMYVRLAFAVAAHLEPEILVVDEVLAVGDAQFQKKCLGKMDVAAAKEGKTIIIVSHNLPVINSLCSRCILINKGKIIIDGAVTEAIAGYLSGTDIVTSAISWDNLNDAPGNDIVRLKSVRIVQEDSQFLTSDFDISREISVEIEYVNLREGSKLYAAFWLKDKTGVEILSTDTSKYASLTPDPWAGVPHPIGVYRSRCTFPANFFNEGIYSITPIVGLDPSNTQILERDMIAFNGIDLGDMRTEYLGGWLGVIRPKLPWSTDYIPTSTKEERTTA